TIVEEYLKKQFRNHRYAHMCRAALDLVVPPFSKIDDLSSKYNLSNSQFRDLFAKVIGCSPKQFHRTRRINCIIGEHDKVNSLTKLAFKYGYFDQPHFINDFKSVTGFTPSRFSRKSLLHNPALLNS
ncbi:MAG: helix-turn-helix domain-containing protein, partial [Bacteroidota bacterium]